MGGRAVDGGSGKPLGLLRAFVAGRQMALDRKLRPALPLDETVVEEGDDVAGRRMRDVLDDDGHANLPCEALLSKEWTFLLKEFETYCTLYRFFVKVIYIFGGNPIYN